MVGVGGLVELVRVAVPALVADAVEAQGRLVGHHAIGDRVAFLAAHRRVRPDEREAIVEVELGDVVHEPVVRRVAAGTVVADGLLVDVLVAGVAVGLGVFEHQFIVAVPAVHVCVAAREREIRLVVVEFAGINGQEHPGRLGLGRLMEFDARPVILCNRPARR